MTNADKSSIVYRVNLIHKNRETMDRWVSQKDKIDREISEMAGNTNEIVDELKRNMGKKTTLNVKIEDKYYTLTQNSVGVDIEQMFIHVEI